MKVYWDKLASERIPAVVKRQGRLYTRIAYLENDQVVYRAVNKEQIVPRTVDTEIDGREQAEMQRRALRKQLFS